MALSRVPAVRRIVITRGEGQNEVLRAELKKAFAGNVEVIELPCVEFREPEKSSALDCAIRSINAFDWILFSSQNAARYMARRMRALGAATQDIAGQARTAALGRATADAAAAEGFSVDFVSDSGTGRGFASSFKTSVGRLSGMKILVPRSNVALRDRGAGDWAEILREVGAEVTSVTAYETYAPDGLKMQLAEVAHAGMDCFVFASPSAFQNFARAVGADSVKGLARASVFAAIGPTTAAAIRAAGVDCAIESTEPDAKLLAHAIASYLNMSHGSGARPVARQGAN